MLFKRKCVVVCALGLTAILLGRPLSAQQDSEVLLVVHEASDVLPEPSMTLENAPLPPHVAAKPTTDEQPQLPLPDIKAPAVPAASQPPSVAAIVTRLPSTSAPSPSSGESDVEKVTDRYPDGTIHVEREVALNAEKNFVNNGAYVAYDTSGAVTLRGHYRMGNMDGLWIRQFASGDEKSFMSGLPGGIQGSLVAEATFENGTLNGAWVVKTQDEKKLAEWHFLHGLRHGTSTWWYLNGQKRCELTYNAGQPVGELVEWDESGKQTGSSKFVDGRLAIRVAKWYAAGQKAYEGYYLHQQDMGELSADWWTGSRTVATKEPAGGEIPDARHGLWTSYYRNGQKEIEGEFRNDVPVGKFTWWYENGQRQAQGSFLDGTQHGTWVTWYTNGQRESQTEYQRGELVGQTMRWKPDGTLANIQDFQNVPSSAEKVPNIGTVPKKASRVTTIPLY